MSTGKAFWGSLCVEDIFGQHILKGQNGKHYICIEDLQAAGTPFQHSTKNGKTYIGVNQWVNETIDDNGNISSITLQQTKEQSEAREKRKYIGNLKPQQQRQQQSQPQQQSYSQPQYQQPTGNPGGLPF